MQTDLRRINWSQIVITIMITGAVTIATSMVLFRLQEQKPHLVYSFTETIPFAGQNQVVGIYQVFISNEGKKAVEDVDCNIRIPEATIEQQRISVDPAMIYSDSVINDSIKLHLPGMNPQEAVQISILATALKKLPSYPEVSLRAKGVTGIEKSKEKETRFEWLSISAALVGVIVGMLTFVYRKISLIKKKFGEIEEEEEKDADRHSDDQRKILSYICGIHGMTEKSNHYLEQAQTTSYWAESDRLTQFAIASKSQENMEKIKSVLKDLIEYAYVAKKSRGIIFYNLARIAASLGNLDEMREYISQAKDIAPKLINTRIKLDPLFKEIKP